jgi:hypothetical protein
MGFVILLRLIIRQAISDEAERERTIKNNFGDLFLSASLII